ncbi:MAG: biotin/lipoyl-binding protein [Alistipes sp.]|nr:biotin/lipoyl-binding protein [Alistipes sp.]MBQ8778277.1 biotin/lipoyl-binding protein [Alistipes sp.]MBR2169728.1 biotin/lipoyl-binding protein [Alistipes sp.]MBR2331915.1 biotin/lipoyl-binding protein [Alistipes sp.]MBR2398927.1 biotin/lipoyl-binding protein [Alistipes sp.]
MQKLNFNINGKHYEATITEVEHNVAEVELNGKKYTIDVERSEAVAVPHIATPKAAPVAAAPAAAAPAPKKAAAGANAIVAPLPGSVVSISVKAGDAVKSGQQLAVIEAMKMENEILAPADGTVKAVHVSAGQAVQQGDALIELA